MKKKDEWISKKYKKVCKILNYTENLIIFAPAVTGCTSVSAFTSSVGIPIGITSSAATIKIRTITTGMKKYMSIIKKKKKKHDKIVLLAKAKLNTPKVSISKALVDSNISHDVFVLINNALKEYDHMKKEIRNSCNIMTLLMY